MSIKAAYYSTLGISAIVGAAIAQALGGWDSSLQLLALLMTTDYVSGLACALFWHKSPKTKNGKFQSETCFKGLFRKAGILATVLIAVQLDTAAHTSFLRDMTVFFFAANEGFSVVENFGIIGLPMPTVITEAFELLRQKGDTKPPKK